MSGEVLLRLFVPGRARTKGHMTPQHIRGGRGRKCKVWLQDRDETKAWMKTLISAIRRYPFAAGAPYPFEGPVELHTFFRFERTLSVAKGAAAGQAWESHNTPWPTADDIGDEDTLRRAIGDALTQSRVLADDDLVVGGSNYKRWCRPGEVAGVAILVLPAPHVDGLTWAEAQWMAHE
jgi:Holliday junction resolvase RusA-like endonuclease